MSVSAGSVVLVPVERYPLGLAELLEQVSPEDLREETDWGKAKGRESW